MGADTKLAEKLIARTSQERCKPSMTGALTATKIIVNFLNLCCNDNVVCLPCYDYVDDGDESKVDAVMRTGNLPLTITYSQITGVLGVV